MLTMLTRFQRLAHFSALGLIAALLLGCGNGDGEDAAEPTGSDEDQAAELAIPQPMQDFEDDGNVAEITIEGDDMMRFDVREFTVEPGQMVRLTLEHVGGLPAATMGHNVVILEQGEDAVAFGNQTQRQGADMDNEYVPEAMRDRVIAFTAMIGGGETAVVEFRAPDEPGDYEYLCSFSGHWNNMNGVMTVE